MKFGMRTPNLSKSIKARTTGRIKRATKRAINPVYGKKGIEYINNPRKAIYNNIYSKTTVGINDILKIDTTTDNTTNEIWNKNWSREGNNIYFNNKLYSEKKLKRLGKITLITSIILILLGLCIMPIGIIFLIMGIVYFNLARKELKEAKKENR